MHRRQHDITDYSDESYSIVEMDDRMFGICIKRTKLAKILSIMKQIIDCHFISNDCIILNVYSPPIIGAKD